MRFFAAVCAVFCVCVCVCVWCAACPAPPPSSSSTPPAPECRDDLPPPSDPCLEGQCGNELGVGQPCTQGGGECDVFNVLAGEAGICVPDFSGDSPTQVFCCTKTCAVDDDCGSGAVCAADPRDANRKGCVPAGCEGR